MSVEVGTPGEVFGYSGGSRRGGRGGGGLDFLALLALFHSVISALIYPREINHAIHDIKGPTGPSPRSATGLNIVCVDTKFDIKSLLSVSMLNLVVNFKCHVLDDIMNP